MLVTSRIQAGVYTRTVDWKHDVNWGVSVYQLRLLFHNSDSQKYICLGSSLFSLNYIDIWNKRKCEHVQDSSRFHNKISMIWSFSTCLHLFSSLSYKTWCNICSMFCLKVRAAKAPPQQSRQSITIVTVKTCLIFFNNLSNFQIWK